MLKRLQQKPPRKWRRQRVQCNGMRAGSRDRAVRLVGAAFRRMFALTLALTAVAAGAEARAADRTTCLLPLGGGAAAEPPPAGAGPADAWRSPEAAPPAPVNNDVVDAPWRAYLRLWRAHHADPADRAIRRFLGLPSGEATQIRARRGRSPQRWLGWPSGRYQQVETQHFQLLSRAERQVTEAVARDLERVYWVWTQLFFPLWDQRDRVGAMLAGLEPDEPVADYLAQHSFRLPVAQKLRVVLFRDASRYRATLGREVPGIERSTGYYSDARRTTFLYAAGEEDAATRRHELAHQLFREATDSSLGRRGPGESAGFWLVEGVAGYFESLLFDERTATIGGWDAPRLQYARYRVLAGGDSVPLSELRNEGRETAQQRSDLARWYAHAIAHTHRLFDGGDPEARRWVYRRLAELYAVDAAWSAARSAPETDTALFAESPRRLREFLSVDDQHLREHPIDRPLKQLCLARCEVTAAGLATIAPSAQLRWLDLSRLPISGRDVARLVVRPESLEQLSLEATRVDASVAGWLDRADRLQELDLSWTAVDDSVIDALSEADHLETLWLTGTDLSDAAVDSLIDIRGLETVDLQRTGITDAALQRLQRARPRLKLNPLELRSP